MENKIWRQLYVIFLIIYIVLLVVVIAITGSTKNVGGLPYLQKIMRSINLIPFMKLGTMQQIGHSIIIYMPLAILLPNAFVWCQTRRHLYSTCLLGILFVEIIQPITLKGYGDINTVILGMLGIIFIFESLQYVKKKSIKA